MYKTTLIGLGKEGHTSQTAVFSLSLRNLLRAVTIERGRIAFKLHVSRLDQITPSGEAFVCYSKKKIKSGDGWY